MRIAAALVLLALSFTSASAQSGATPASPAITSFAGRWSLDTVRSRDLPAFYAAVREHRLLIAQDDSTVTVDVTMTDTAGAAQQMQFAYNLLRPVRTTTQVRTPNGPVAIPTTLTAAPRADGGIEVAIQREFTMGERVIRPDDRETWHLSADGRQLLIYREAEMPGPGGMRAIRAHYVFVRG